MAAWLVVYAARQVVRARDRAIVTLRIDGLRLTLDWAAAEHVPVREVVARHEYEPSAEWAPGEGATVVDVGANAGVFATRAARAVGPTGRVLAVEPNRDAADRLEQNARQNGLGRRVSIHRVALGEHDGTAQLIVGRNTTTGRIENEDSDPQERRDKPGTDVPLRRLDSLAAECGISTVDLIKVDVEGREAEVLAGAAATLGSTRRVVMEVSGGRSIREVEAQLRSAGLSRIRAMPAGPDSGARLVFAERA
jgi:FkbM family methyltransferase